MLGVFGLTSSTSRRNTPQRAMLTPVRALFLLLAVLAVAATVRPGSLPGGSTFNSSTTFHRTVLATAGYELFREHPIVGVGWSRGPMEIGSDRIDQRLRDIFGSGLRSDFLPSSSPVSVHNAYIELLAEAGIVGFLCFLAMLVAAVSGIRAVLRSAAGDPRLMVCASCAVVLLVGLLVWWNDNALFGAQPETVLAATLLGMLAAMPRADARATASGAGTVGIT
jgi:O-antigen ligase